MLYDALDTEIPLIRTMTADERLQYAVTRMIECEEVWSQGDANGWKIHDSGRQQVIRVWPYRQFSEECCTGDSSDAEPQATSIEHFVYGVLGACNTARIMLEVFPRPDEAGKHLTADELYQILNGLLETAEYVIEG